MGHVQTAASDNFSSRVGKYGKAAGMIRNKQMLNSFKPDAVVAFATGCGPGTKGMIELSRKSGTKTIVIDGSGIVVDDLT